MADTAWDGGDKGTQGAHSRAFPPDEALTIRGPEARPKERRLSLARAGAVIPPPAS